MNRSPIAAVVVALAQAAWPCEEIAVLSHYGKYMILDGQTLETLDVGDLRWHGVWGIDSVVPGSTLARFAFVTDALSAELAKSDDSGHFQRTALVVVTDLTERAISHGYEFSIGDALWIDGTDQLIVWERSNARVAVLDEGLEELDAFSSSDWKKGATLACRRDGDLFIATDSRRTIRREGESVVDGLATPDGFEGCRVETPTRRRYRSIVRSSSERPSSTPRAAMS